MLKYLPIFPEQASTLAPKVDALFFFLIGVSAFFATLIAVLVIAFAIKFRRRSTNEHATAIHGSLALELTWTLIPFGLTMLIFLWGASVFLSLQRPPDDATEVFVVGKQWMWKIQHPEGRREINELHVPQGQAIKLTMTSEDVIHSFFVPAFRIKQDVLPGRYTTAWFQPTKPGKYHLFCAEYCGTEHSGMIGSVVVMEPAAYQAWLGGETGAPVVEIGAALFNQLGCQSCHQNVPGARGPSLVGLFGKTVTLQGGATVVADEAYLRESILNPHAKIVRGYTAIMPTFQGLVSEEGLMQLLAYVKSLAPQSGGTGDSGPGVGDREPQAGDRGSGVGDQGSETGEQGVGIATHARLLAPYRETKDTVEANYRDQPTREVGGTDKEVTDEHSELPRLAGLEGRNGPR